MDVAAAAVKHADPSGAGNGRGARSRRSPSVAAPREPAAGPAGQRPFKAQDERARNAASIFIGAGRAGGAPGRPRGPIANVAKSLPPTSARSRSRNGSPSSRSPSPSRNKSSAPSARSWRPRKQSHRPPRPGPLT